MKLKANAIVVLASVVGLTFGIVTPGEAAENWKFRVAPYLWTAGISGEIGPSAMPSAVDVDFSDYVEFIDIGVAGSVEAIHKGGWFFFAEGMYSELSMDGRTPMGAEVGVESKMAYATVAFGKSVFKNVELYGGGRYLYNSVAIDLGPGLGGEGSQDWVDPIIGFRVRGDVNEKVFLRLAMDVGGFGVNSDLTYAMAANINYQLTDTWTSIFGYRALDIDYDKGGFVFNDKQDGLVFGLGYTF